MHLKWPRGFQLIHTPCVAPSLVSLPCSTSWNCLPNKLLALKPFRQSTWGRWGTQSKKTQTKHLEQFHDKKQRLKYNMFLEQEELMPATKIKRFSNTEMNIGRAQVSVGTQEESVGRQS